jgi:DNA-directed RNA polymerase subunit RPC12/RpoP
MLGEFDPPEPMIKYNCPRCKKPLESPASEALTKKPCPACGGRLQVPAAPPKAPVGDPSLNKTLLAETSVTPSVPVNGGALPSQPTSSAPPAAPPPTPAATPTFLAGNTWKYAAGGVAAALLLLVALGLAGRSAAEAEYRKALAEHEKKNNELMAMLQELKNEIKQRENDKVKLEQQGLELQKHFKDRLDELERQRKDREAEYEKRLRQAQELEDAQLLAQLKQKKLDEERRVAEEKRRAEEEQRRTQRELEDRLAALQRQLESTKQKEKETTTIIQQQPTVVPAPVPYYYPWRYHPWWW